MGGETVGGSSLHEYQRIHVLARAVIVNEGHILLAYDPRKNPYHYYELSKHFYTLPGGHVEWQESAQKALVREIREELGKDIAIERFVGVIEHAWHFPGDSVCCHTHEVNLVFQCDGSAFDRTIIPPQREAHVAFEWACLESIDTIDLRPTRLRNALKDWLQPRGRGPFFVGFSKES